MSRLNPKSNSGRGVLGRAIAQIGTVLTQQGAALVSKETTRLVSAMESNMAHMDEIVRKGDEVRIALKQAFESVEGLDIETDLNDTQLEAAQMAFMAAGDPSEYMKAATAVVATESFKSDATRLLGGQDQRLVSAFETYDDRSIREFLPFSVIFNAFAVRQSEFAETLFKTIVLSPDQAGVTVKVPKAVVFNEVKHTLTGAPTNFNMRNVLDAVVDPTLLATQNDIKITPVKTVDNAAYFVDNAVVAAYNVPAAGGTVSTAPLVFGKAMNLLSIGNTPNLLGQQQGQTDALDHLLGVEAIYLSFTDNTAVTPITSIVRVPVQYMTGAHFLPAREGIDSAMTLSFHIDDLAITGATKDIAGAAAGALAYLTSGGRENWVLRLKLTLTGRAELYNGTVEVAATGVAIDSVWNKGTDGTLTEVVGADLTTLATEIPVIAAVGWDPRAYRSNLNKRIRGVLADSFEFTESIMVPMGSPITMLGATSSDKAASKIESVVAIARYRNDNNAITALQGFAAALQAIGSDSYAPGRIPGIFGMGRHLLRRPFYERIDLDIAAEINNLTSTDRQADVASVIANVCREAIYRATKATNYMAALEAYTGRPGAKPTLVFATDTNIQPHLIVNGDDRLASVGFPQYKIVASPEDRMKGKLYMTFVLPEENDVCPLSFGNFLYMSELASVLPVDRQGQTSNEATVHPRNIHICNLPLLIEINITGLADALTKKTAINFHDVP